MKTFVAKILFFSIITAQEAQVGEQSAYKKLASRSTANYTYTGKSSAGQQTSRVSFTINKLTQGDEGTYILKARTSSFSTNLSVNCLTPGKKVSGGVCAGHIIGLEVGVILICVFIYVYLVVWKATDETGKRVGFIIAVVVGLALMIALSVSYAGLRKSNDNDDLEDCDKAFIAFGVIDIVALIVVVIISVKNFKGSQSKTSYQPNSSRETTPLKSTKNTDGNQSTNKVCNMYVGVGKENKSKPQTAANNNGMELEEFVVEPQGATTMPPQDLSSMNAQVNENQTPPKEHTIYSELGPGGGPKPIVQPSHYAEAKDFAPQYSAPQRPPKGSDKASSKEKEVNGHYNNVMGDDSMELD